MAIPRPGANHLLPPHFRQQATIEDTGKMQEKRHPEYTEREEKDAAKNRFGDLGERDKEQEFFPDQKSCCRCCTGDQQVFP